MQPKTSVRQPVIAGARRQHLSELLRQWRRQPRKRSPLLFWTLLSLALMSDSGLLFLTARLAPGLPGAVPPASRGLNETIKVASWFSELAPARLPLFSSFLAVFFFTAAATAKLRWPLWRRRSLIAGVVCSLICLGVSAPFLLQVICGSGPPIHDGGQGMLWSATLILGLSLILAAVFGDASLALVGALASCAGFLAASAWPVALAERWPALPQGDAGDICLRVQVLMLLSAYAALALAWTIAAVALVRILVSAPGSERLRRLAALCFLSIRVGLLLLTASALLDGLRTLEQGCIWHGGDAQALGTLLVLPACAALVTIQRRIGISPFRLLLSMTLGVPFLVMSWQTIVLWTNGHQHLASTLAPDVATLAMGLLSLSLATHAALRYYFGKQRILEV